LYSSPTCSNTKSGKTKSSKIVLKVNQINKYDTKKVNIFLFLKNCLDAFIKLNFHFSGISIFIFQIKYDITNNTAPNKNHIS